MNAMCTGIRFWLITAIAAIPASMPHFTQKAVFCPEVWPSSRRMRESASSCVNPEWATAMAKAPSSA